MKYIVTYQLKDDPYYEHEDEFSNLRKAMEKAYEISLYNSNDGAIRVYDPEGVILVELD